MPLVGAPSSPSLVSFAFHSGAATPAVKCVAEPRSSKRRTIVVPAARDECARRRRWHRFSNVNPSIPPLPTNQKKQTKKTPHENHHGRVEEQVFASILFCCICADRWKYLNAILWWGKKRFSGLATWRPRPGIMNRYSSGIDLPTGTMPLPSSGTRRHSLNHPHEKLQWKQLSQSKVYQKELLFSCVE